MAGELAMDNFVGDYDNCCDGSSIVFLASAFKPKIREFHAGTIDLDTLIKKLRSAVWKYIIIITNHAMVYGCKTKFVVIDNPFSSWRKGFYMLTCDSRSGPCDSLIRFAMLLPCDSLQVQNLTCDLVPTNNLRFTNPISNSDPPHNPTISYYNRNSQTQFTFSSP